MDIAQYVERFFALAERAVAAYERDVALREAAAKSPSPAPDPTPTPTPTTNDSDIPAPPALPPTDEPIIFEDDFAQADSIPDPTEVKDGTTYHWAAGNTANATTTIARLRDGAKAALIRVFGVTRDAQQGARAFLVNDGRWDFLTPDYGEVIRVVIDFYLKKDWKAGSGDGYFTTVPLEVKRKSDESASVQINLDENGVFWLAMPYSAGVHDFHNPVMSPVKRGWNRIEVRMLLSADESAWCELDYAGVVVHGVGAVSGADETTALALTNYSNAVTDLDVYIGHVRITCIPQK